MELFEAPLSCAEFKGQPIEQFGLIRRRAEPAEVGGRLNESVTKMVHPESIDENTRRERVVGTGQPTSQGESAARRRELLGRA